MNVGILGYGKIGKLRHDVIEKLYGPLINNYYIYDPMINNGNTPESVIRGSDAIFVCSPNFKNVEYTTMALKAGKHVFCEKPPARNYQELLEVKNVYNNDLTLLYGFNHRQYDSVRKIKEIIDSDKFGKLLWLRGRYGKSITKDEMSGWRMDVEKSGGGIVLDQGLHMLDLMVHFTGGFDEVQSIITNSLWDIKGIEDNAFINLYNSEKNIAASLHSTMIEWRHIFSLELLFETGYLALNGLKTPSGSYGKEVLTICTDKHNLDEATSTTKIEYPQNKTWDREITNFFTSILENKNETNLHNALKVMKIMEKIYGRSK